MALPKKPGALKFEDCCPICPQCHDAVVTVNNHEKSLKQD